MEAKALCPVRLNLSRFEEKPPREILIRDLPTTGCNVLCTSPMPTKKSIIEADLVWDIFSHWLWRLLSLGAQVGKAGMNPGIPKAP